MGFVVAFTGSMLGFRSEVLVVVVTGKWRGK